MTLVDRIISSDLPRSGRALDRVSFTAAAYLFIPNLIFLAGWLQPVAALLLIALGLLGLWRLRALICSVGESEYWVLIAILVFAASWVMLGGAGHFFYANHDWQVRDAVLGDLVFGDWPVAYGYADGNPLLLRSAIGYFLPAALVGKAFGIGYVDWALYLWTVLGTAIFLLLLPLPKRPRPLLFICALIVMFFSGMDVLGVWMIYDLWPSFPQSIEWWVPYSYSSLSAQLFWAPNHSLPIWILSALLYRHWAHPVFWTLMLFVLPLSLIWTPFAIAGVAPFIPIAALNSWKQKHAIDIDYRLLIFSVLLGYVSFRFITLDLGGLPIHWPGEVTKGTNVSIFPAPSLTDYLIFVEMEFAILALALLPTLRHSFGIFGMAVLILFLLPIVSLGPSKDTMLRLSVTPLLVLLMLILGNLQDWAKEKSIPSSVYVIGAVLMFGTPSAFFEMARSLLWPRAAPNYTKSLVEQQGGGMPSHYVARLNQPDMQWILSKPKIVTPSTGRKTQL